MTTLSFSTIGPAAQRFRVADVGDGPPVVLLHGFPDTPQSWAATAETLVRAGHRVVVPYLRGYHHDTIVAGRSYGRSEVGEDVVRLLDALDLSAATLVGHDWGAWCAWSAAEQAPTRVTGLVAVAIPHPSRVRLTASSAWGARHVVTLRLPGAARRLARRDGAAVATYYDRWASGWRGRDRDDAIARARGVLADPRLADHALRWYRDLTTPGARPAPFRCPALLVAGGRDLVDVAAFEATRRLFATPEDVEVMVVEAAGHWPHREDGPRFLAALTAFLERDRA